jgi:hypothetical protein
MFKEMCCLAVCFFIFGCEESSSSSEQLQRQDNPNNVKLVEMSAVSYVDTWLNNGVLRIKPRTIDSGSPVARYVEGDGFILSGLGKMFFLPTDQEVSLFLDDDQSYNVAIYTVFNTKEGLVVSAGSSFILNSFGGVYPFDLENFGLGIFKEEYEWIYPPKVSPILSEASLLFEVAGRCDYIKVVFWSTDGQLDNQEIIIQPGETIVPPVEHEDLYAYSCIYDSENGRVIMSQRAEFSFRH